MGRLMRRGLVGQRNDPIADLTLLAGDAFAYERPWCDPSRGVHPRQDPALADPAAAGVTRHRRLDRGPPPFRRANSRFVVDSALEGGVSCELVSEMPNSLLAGKIQGISGIMAQTP